MRVGEIGQVRRVGMIRGRINGRERPIRGMIGVILVHP